MTERTYVESMPDPSSAAPFSRPERVNVVFVAAGVLTALVLPETGKSAVAVIGIGLAYLVTGAAYYLSSDVDPAIAARRTSS